MMEYDEAAAKDITIRKLQIEVGVWQAKCNKLERDIEFMRSENAVFLCEVETIKKNAQPLRDTVNALTAERGKWLRKLKRAGINK